MTDQTTIPNRSFAQSLAALMRTRGVRFLVMLFLILIMAVPIFMVWGVVADRASYNQNAINEVSELWGGDVALAGPVIHIPVTKTIITKKKEEDGTISEVESKVEGEPIILLAENTDIVVDAASQIRKRGIFEVPVYQAQISITADFDRTRIPPKIKSFETVRWAEAEMILKLPARRSFFGDTTVTINGKATGFEPGTPAPNLSGIRVPLNFTSNQIKAQAKFGLNGARTLSVSPLARETTLAISSDWPDPSFQGSFLPAERSVSDSGFSANWSVPHLALNIPQVSRDISVLQPATSGNTYYSRYSSGRFSDPTAFGVRFIQTLDFYHLVERAVKYGFLFVSLTFLTLFLLEGLSKTPVHPAQFILIGVAEATFFLLLLAFAEQIGFSLSYLGASAATIALLTFYGLTALQLGRRVFVLTALLVLLYAVLYIILQSADYALLIGAVLSFGAVAATMIVTRNERWYRDPNA